MSGVLVHVLNEVDVAYCILEEEFYIKIIVYSLPVLMVGFWHSAFLRLLSLHLEWNFRTISSIINGIAGKIVALKC